MIRLHSRSMAFQSLLPMRFSKAILARRLNEAGFISSGSLRKLTAMSLNFQSMLLAGHMIRGFEIIHVLPE